MPIDGGQRLENQVIRNGDAAPLGTPRPGDIVTLSYPVDPDKIFVKRVIAQEGDSVRIVGGRVFVNDVPLREDYVDAAFRSYENWGPELISHATTS
jgi:signal peptidase I